MYICFKCHQSFDSVNLLTNHFKHNHFLDRFDTVKCVQSDCGQIFRCIKSFRKHLLQLHGSNSLQDSTFVRLHPQLHQQPNTNQEPHCEDNCIVTELEPIKEISCDNVISQLLLFLLELYAKNNVPRNDVQNIQKSVSSILIEFGKLFTSVQNNCIVPKDLAELIIKPFGNFDTEHKFLKHLKSLNLYDSPVTFILNSSISHCVLNGNPTLAPRFSHIYLLPIRFQIKKFFEVPNVLKLTLQNIKKAQDGNDFINYASSESFKIKRNILNKEYVIPYILYFDDYEINNPLGSRCYSICAGYYSFPNVPQYLQSKLDFVFNFSFVSTKIMKSLGNSITFFNIVREIKYLEETGLDIKIDNQIYRVHFVLGLVVGDNLGLNSILGFLKSFNSKFFCRVCKLEKSETRLAGREITEKLRNKMNYDHDLIENDKLATVARFCNFAISYRKVFTFKLSQGLYRTVRMKCFCNSVNSPLR